MYVNLVI